MFHMILRRRNSITCTLGTDRVCVAVSLPRGSVVHDVRGVVKMTNGANLSGQDIVCYGLEMVIVPVPDPDSSSNFNTLWDQLVPKDKFDQTIDLDTTAADATPFFEPGEVDWSQVLDIGKRPERLWGGYKFMQMNDAIATFRNDGNTAVEWTAGATVPVRVKRSYRVSQPSVLMLALSSPSLDQTTAAGPTMLAENEWSRIKYAKQMLEQAMISLIGLEEAGAETPWEDQVDLLQEFLEPQMLEETAGRFVPGTWNAFADFKIGLSVTGELSLKTLSTGR